MIIDALIGAVVAAFLWALTRIFEGIRSIWEFASASPASAAAFTILFVLLFTLIAMQAYDNGVPLAVALFGNVTSSEATLDNVVNNDTAINFLNSELAFVEMPGWFGNPLIRRSDPEFLSPEDRLAWKADDSSDCGALASAKADDYVWSDVMIPTHKLPPAETAAIALGGYYEAHCGYRVVTDTIQLNSTTLNDLIEEVDNFSSSNSMCADQIHLHDGQWYGFLPSISSCYMIRTNDTKQRIYIASPFDEFIPGMLMLEVLWGAGVKSDVILPDPEAEITVHAEGVFTSVLVVWEQARNVFANRVPNALGSPVIWLMNMFEGLIYTGSMIIITLLAMIVMFTLARFLK